LNGLQQNQNSAQNRIYLQYYQIPWFKKLTTKISGLHVLIGLYAYPFLVALEINSNFKP